MWGSSSEPVGEAARAHAALPLTAEDGMTQRTNAGNYRTTGGVVKPAVQPVIPLYFLCVNVHTHNYT